VPHRRGYYHGPSGAPAGVPGDPSYHYGHYGKAGAYPQPANWATPAVGTADLAVNGDALKTAASALDGTEKQLRSALTAWSGPAQDAAANAGEWDAAKQMGDVIKRTHDGVQQYITQLAQWHTDTSTMLVKAASTYHSADEHNARAAASLEAKTKAAIATSSSQGDAWTVQAGGGVSHVNPFQGMSPQAQAMAERLSHMDPEAQQSQTWTNSYNITDGKAYNPGSTANVTAKSLPAILATADTGKISNAAAQTTGLVQALTDATTTLSTQAQNLSANWSGKGALSAISQMQQLHQTATSLQTNAWSAQQAMGYYAQVVSDYQNATPIPTNAPSGFSTIAAQSYMGQADAAAQQRLADLNQNIGTAYTNMPPQLQTALPQPKTTHSGGTSGGGTSGGSGAGGLGGVGTSGGTGGTGGPLPPGSTPLPGSPGVSTPAPITLASVPPGATMPTTTTPVTTPMGTTLPGTTSSVVPPVTMPSIPSGSSGSSGTSGDGSDPGLGDSDPGSIGVPGLGSLGTGAAGSGTATSGAGDGVGTTGDDVGVGDGITSPGDGAVGFPGMGGMGGMGGFGGAGGSGEGRLRQAWESEEDGLWDSPADGTFAAADVPGLSGDGMIGAGGAFGDAPAAVFGGTAGGAGAMAGADGTTAADNGMFPFMGGAGAGAGGRGGNDRQRQSWMSEDADVWDPGANGVPPVIG
jgi:hypothetical protein